MLNVETDEMYERTCERRACRAGHCECDLTMKAGTMTFMVPKLKGTLSSRRRSTASGGGSRASRRRRSTCTWPSSRPAGLTRHQPVAVERTHALADALGYAQERCTRRSTNDATGRWDIRTCICSWTACGDRRTWSGSVGDGERPSRHRRGRHRPP